MASSSDVALTESQATAFFLSPEGPLHRQYEALRAYFVEQSSSARTARRFAYSPGSFRVLCHHFRHDPEKRSAFFQSLSPPCALLDASVEEGLHQLQTLCVTEVKVEGGASCPRIPTPSVAAAALIKAPKIRLLEALPHTEIVVVTRKKLPARRKPRQGPALCREEVTPP